RSATSPSISPRPSPICSRLKPARGSRGMRPRTLRLAAQAPTAPTQTASAAVPPDATPADAVPVALAVSPAAVPAPAVRAPRAEVNKRSAGVLAGLPLL